MFTKINNRKFITFITTILLMHGDCSIRVFMSNLLYISAGQYFNILIISRYLTTQYIILRKL